MIRLVFFLSFGIPDTPGLIFCGQHSFGLDDRGYWYELWASRANSISQVHRPDIWAIPPKVFLYVCLIDSHCLSIDPQQSLALEECRARALAPEEGFDGLESMDLEAQGATFDSCALAKPAAPTFSSTAPTTADDVEAPMDELVPGPSRQGSPPRSPAASRAASSVATPPALRATPPLSNARSPPRSGTPSPTAPHAASTPHTRPAGASLPHVPSPSSSPSPSLPAPPRQKRKRAEEEPEEERPTAPEEEPRVAPEEEPPAAQRKSKRSKAVASAAAAKPNAVRPSQSTAVATSCPPLCPTWRTTKTLPQKELTAVIPVSSPASPVQTRKRGNDDSSVAQRSSKRPKAASSAAVGPGWFSSALGMLQSPETPLGERWAILVELWVEFEKKEGFKEHGFLPAKGRPECVSEWIRRGRPPGWMPTVTASKLETAFKAWWLSLQPKGRVSGKGAMIATDLESGGWEVLRKPGLNGLLSALVGLFYWGGALKRSAKQHAAWATCVEDCILVLGHLVE